MENMKKLQRDTRHKVIGGVCSGLANYFDIDVVLVRILFVFALLALSSGFWLYVILWIVLPAGDGTIPETTMADSAFTEPKKSNGGLYAGTILIGIGLLGLLNRYIPAWNWHTVWPILLIVVGILLIVPLKDKKS
jgi:phage shock protein PspC (stress-responsive transcriptional regulator)